MKIFCSEGDVAVRKLENTEKDMQALLAWLSDERVTEFAWGEGVPWDFESVRDEFGVTDETERCLIIYKGCEVGFIQFAPVSEDSYKFSKKEDYELFEGAYGLDMFIGVPKLWRKGIGRAAVNALCDYLNREYGAEKFSADPSLDNARGLKFWQSIGFEPVMEVPDYDDDRKLSLLTLRKI